MKRFSIGEIITYSVFAVLSLSAIIGALDLGLGGSSELGPGALPFATGLCILGASVTLLIKSKAGSLFRKTSAGPDGLRKAGLKEWGRVAVILLNLAVWPLLVSVTGYVISTWITSLGMARAIGLKGRGRPLVLCTSVAFAVWFIFGFMFEIDLPAWFSG